MGGPEARKPGETPAAPEKGGSRAYYAKVDADMARLGRSRRFAFAGLGLSLSSPAWMRGYRISIRKGRWVWHWHASPNCSQDQPLPHKSRGRSLTLGGAIWAAQKACGA